MVKFVIIEPVANYAMQKFIDASRIKHYFGERGGFYRMAK